MGSCMYKIGFVFLCLMSYVNLIVDQPKNLEEKREKIFFFCMNYISIKLLFKKRRKEKRPRPIADLHPSFCLSMPMSSSLDGEA